MKRILYLVILALLLIGLLFYLKSKKGTNPQASYDVSASKFAIPEIDKVHRIFVADKQGRFVNLTKKKNEWLVNDKYRGDQISIDLLLKSIQKVDIQFIPPAASVSNIIKNIAVHGLSVEIFDQKDNQLRKYYIGGMTQDERGTYFLMDNATQPYVMEVPGFSGNIRERYKPELNRYRSQKFLHFDTDKVTGITTSYPTQDQSSYILKRKTLKDKIKVGPNAAGKGEQDANSVKVDAFLTALSKIACESYLSADPRQDSIMLTTPFCEIEIERSGKDPIELQFWTKSQDGLAAEIGSRYYVRRDDEFLLAQFQVIKPAFRDGKFFVQ